MRLKQKSKVVFKKIRKIPTWVMILLTVTVSLLIVYLVIFFPEKHVSFSYNDMTCIQQLTILPNLNKVTDVNSGFTIKNENITRIGAIQLFSSKTCFTAMKSPKVGSTVVGVALFGSWFAKVNYRLDVPSPPAVSSNTLEQLVPVLKPIILNLSKNDLFFSYQLRIDGKIIPCTVKNSAINCDILPLKLLQDSSYDAKIVRMFKGQNIATVVDRKIKTLSAVTIVDTSVNQDQTVFDKPKSFVFNFDKEVIKANVLISKVEGETRTVVTSTSVFIGKQLTVTINSDLERSATYEFSIDQLEAKDGSTLAAPYKLSFITSDGPIVISVNVGTNSIPLSKIIVLTFDQLLSSDQDITKFVTTSGMPTSITRLNNQIFISFTNAPICAALNIHINPGILSNYGVVQNNSWTFNTRTICHSTSTIGYSVEGRPIIAYTFGNGGSTILYTGSIHGNELSSKYLMDAWVSELESNISNIPTDKKIVVVPTLNPDGVAANRRNNSHNVDLNRNFPVSDWQTDIYTPSNQLLAGGGGTAPLSEPESRAIAAFSIELRPRLTMSYHGAAGYAIGNQSGDSSALAAEYSQLTGYRDMTGVAGAFSYPITGTYDDWLREENGLTSVLVELSSNSNSEFSRNRAALWTMARS